MKIIGRLCWNYWFDNDFYHKRVYITRKNQPKFCKNSKIKGWTLLSPRKKNKKKHCQWAHFNSMKKYRLRKVFKKMNTTIKKSATVY